MQIQNYLKTKIINHNWKVHIEKCTFQQINPDKYEKPIIFLLVLITNILFISAQKISKTELKDKIGRSLDRANGRKHIWTSFLRTSL